MAMKTFALLGTCALFLVTSVPAMAGVDPETDQMACDLAGQCDAAAPDAGGEATAPTTPHGARSGATRGFTFKRQAPTATVMPAPAAQTASATPRPAVPARVGVSNLRLEFASGSAVLDEADRVRLAKLAKVLGGPALAARRARIEGHTDASGSASANVDLSRRRAQSVADYLVSVGVAADRLEVVGLGSAQPLPGVPERSAQNRRVMAVILN
jgi:OOP family OmpA-OmpF porin